MVVCCDFVIHIDRLRTEDSERRKTVFNPACTCTGKPHSETAFQAEPSIYRKEKSTIENQPKSYYSPRASE